MAVSVVTVRLKKPTPCNTNENLLQGCSCFLLPQRVGGRIGGSVDGWVSGWMALSVVAVRVQGSSAVRHEWKLSSRVLLLSCILLPRREAPTPVRRLACREWVGESLCLPLLSSRANWCRVPFEVGPYSHQATRRNACLRCNHKKHHVIV